MHVQLLCYYSFLIFNLVTVLLFRYVTSITVYFNVKYVMILYSTLSSIFQLYREFSTFLLNSFS